MNTSKLLFSVAIVLAAATFPVLAQDDGLYNEPPPPGSAFVRVLAAQGSLAPTASVGDTSFTLAPIGAAAPYAIIKGGTLPIAAGDTSSQAEFAAPGFYSVVLHDGVASVIDDTIEQNLTKATIVFYNLTANDALGLSTADGKTPVFATVPAWTSANIAVNPISIAFGANLAGQVLSSTAEIQLERGSVYSVIASGTDTISITVEKNAVAQ